MALFADDDDLDVAIVNADLPKAKDKKDKRLRLDEKRGSLRTLPWTKNKDKDSITEKTPKKGKHNRNKSGSRTPPDSPKALRAERGGKTNVSNQPSPNVKSNRKSYALMDDMSDDENQDFSEGYMNQPADDELIAESINPPETTQPIDTGHTNPWAVSIENSPPKLLQPEPSDPWQVSPSKPTAAPSTVQAFPVILPLSPDKPSKGSLGAGMLGSPVREAQPLSYQPVTALAPPPQPMAQQATAAASSEPDWSVSDELLDKCVGQFKDLSGSSGLLQGDKAREFFLKSKLPNQELSAIWRLSDVNKDNALSEYEFCVAMKLVMMRRKGHDIPNALPPALLSTLLPRSFSDSFPRNTSPLLDQSETETPYQQTGVLVDIDSLVGEQPFNSALSKSLDTHETERLVNPALVDIESPLVEGDTEATALVLGHRRTGSEGSISEKPSSKAKVQRSKTVREMSNNSSNADNPPLGGVGSGPLINIDQGTPPVARPKATKKKSYTALEDSADSDEPLNDTADGGVHWTHLDAMEGESGQKRGHHRGKSLDLNKMILQDKNKGDGLDDLPSAVPPKLPPRPHQSPPLEQHRATQSGEEDNDRDVSKEGVRPRSLSTGSITASPEHQPLETETNSLIKPKPNKKNRVAPRRPPPPVATGKQPVKPNLLGRADPKEYQPASKDKKELQANIRSLKDKNASLNEFNKTLEAQLFKLMEERVRLERELETLTALD